MRSALVYLRPTPAAHPRDDSLLALALYAMEHADGLAVLGDHVQEQSWYDVRVCRLINPDTPSTKKRFVELAAAPIPQWARAIAAVLLFKDWKRGRLPWPLIRKHLRLQEEALLQQYDVVEADPTIGAAAPTAADEFRSFYPELQGLGVRSLPLLTANGYPIPTLRARHRRISSGVYDHWGRNGLVQQYIHPPRVAITLTTYGDVSVLEDAWVSGAFFRLEGQVDDLWIAGDAGIVGRWTTQGEREQEWELEVVPGPE